MKIVRDAGLPVLAGSDTPALCAAAGEGLVLELKLLSESGYSPLEVLRSATLRPSQVLVPASRLGRLATGYEAHVLLLRRDPLRSTSAYVEPVGLWTRGRWRDEAELRLLRTR
jgi:imidazolonepropionase-like amidohydrolase